MGCLTPSIVLLCVCGVALSAYAIHVEISKHRDNDYRAHCDMDETIACSVVLTSDHSTGMGLVGAILGKDHFLNIPNSYFGIIFFPLLLILGVASSFSKPLLLLSLFLCFISCLTSVYLLYLLVFVLHKICLLCMGVHMTNLILFILFTLKWRALPSSDMPSEVRANGRKKKKAQ